MVDPDKMDEAFARFEQAFERFEAAASQRKPGNPDEAAEVLRAEILRLAEENERSRESARQATAKIDSAMGLIRSAIGEGQGG